MSCAVGRWRSWLAIGHLTLLPVIVVYLLLVAANSWAYDYSFWNDPPPSKAADTAAILSLLGLVVAGAVVGVFAYGWMCRHAAIDDTSLWTSLRAALGRLLCAPCGTPPPCFW